MATITIRVYLRNGGGCFEYDIQGDDAHALGSKAREHLGQIAAGGYRHNDGKTGLEWFPPHWIDKVKLIGLVPTNCPDRCVGT